jgi:hypothetical protein
MRSKAAAIAAAALSLFVAGCGGGGGTVSGTVTLDGTPIKGGVGVVTFHPVGGGPAAMGAVTADGTYTVAIGTETAVPAGEYLVTVEYTETATSEPGPGPPKPPPPPRRLTPEKYANKDTTDLRVPVKAGGNKIPLELKSGK